MLCEIGVSQQEVINHALAAVAAGRAETVVVAGAEARAFARDGGIDTDEEDQPPDEVLTRPPDFVAPVEIAAGMVWPAAQQYALIENALAAAEHLPSERQRDRDRRTVGPLQRGGGAQPRGRVPAARDAADIATPGPHNRPLAYPYNRWHASQWTVDQASALVICSAERARAAGVPPERWLFPHVALHSSAAVTLTARRRLEAWPAMGVLGRAAARHIGRPLRELPLAEVYSCFPAAVRVQQRELGLDPAGTPTLTGGMAFAGGPFNHFVLQSLRVLGDRLRAEPGRARPADHRVGHALQARPGHLVGHAPAGRGRRSWPTWRPRRLRPPTSCPVAEVPPRGSHPGHGGVLHRDLRGRRGIRPRAHRHRGRPPRWGPHRRHLRRCGDRPPRRHRRPHRASGLGEGHDIQPVSAQPPAEPAPPGRPGPGGPGARAAAGRRHAVALAVVSAVAIVVQAVALASVVDRSLLHHASLAP